MHRQAVISLVNFPTLPPDEPDRLHKTLARMAQCVADAAERRSDLVAFPEVCNTLGAADIYQFEALDGPTLAALRRSARQHGIYVVCPLFTMEAGVRRNSAVLIDRAGEIAGIYHKNFPTHGELDHGVIPDERTPVFATDFGRVGLCICFDLNYWEVGSGLAAGEPELVLWSSMWPGGRHLTRWAIEFGFYMGAIYSQQSTFVDLAGRELISHKRDAADSSGASPIVTATLDLERRLLHHDFNVERLPALFARYGRNAAYVEWLRHECLVVFGSELPERSSESLMAEFDLESARAYYARVRRDRQRAMAGEYHPGP